jgi:glycerol-3-phosphate cytidylyltransferase-like family protein
LTQPDNIVEELKGCPPPIPLEERIIILDSIKYVDEVGIYYEKTEDKWIRRFKTFYFPDRFPTGSKLVLFHSEEYKGRDNIPGQHIVDEIAFIPRRYLSTSQIIDNIIRSQK